MRRSWAKKPTDGFTWTRGWAHIRASSIFRIIGSSLLSSTHSWFWTRHSGNYSRQKSWSPNRFSPSPSSASASPSSLPTMSTLEIEAREYACFFPSSLACFLVQSMFHWLPRHFDDWSGINDLLYVLILSCFYFIFIYLFWFFVS